MTETSGLRSPFRAPRSGLLEAQDDRERLAAQEEDTIPSHVRRSTVGTPYRAGVPID